MSIWEGLNPPYSTIVADPPWHYDARPGGKPTLQWVWPSSVIVTPRPSARAHSVKPDCFRDYIEAASPGPYVELFCRSPRFGWDSWGKGYESGAA